eukprot:scaffold16893_cov186-Skeletonema_marinoi.AAC.1
MAINWKLSKAFSPMLLERSSSRRCPMPAMPDDAMDDATEFLRELDLVDEGGGLGASALDSHSHSWWCKG